MATEYQDDDEQVESTTDDRKNVTLSVTAETKEILQELRSIYMLPTWEDALRFLIANMKKVPRPKSRYFD